MTLSSLHKLLYLLEKVEYRNVIFAKVCFGDFFWWVVKVRAMIVASLSVEGLLHIRVVIAKSMTKRNKNYQNRKIFLGSFCYWYFSYLTIVICVRYYSTVCEYRHYCHFSTKYHVHHVPFFSWQKAKSINSLYIQESVQAKEEDYYYEWASYTHNGDIDRRIKTFHFAKPAAIIKLFWNISAHLILSRTNFFHYIQYPYPHSTSFVILPTSLILLKVGLFYGLMILD